MAFELNISIELNISMDAKNKAGYFGLLEEEYNEEI